MQGGLKSGAGTSLAALSVAPRDVNFCTRPFALAGEQTVLAANRRGPFCKTPRDQRRHTVHASAGISSQCDRLD